MVKRSSLKNLSSCGQVVYFELKISIHEEHQYVDSPPTANVIRFSPAHVTAHFSVSCHYSFCHSCAPARTYISSSLENTSSIHWSVEVSHDATLMRGERGTEYNLTSLELQTHTVLLPISEIVVAFSDPVHSVNS
jgi:hypothetical protein